MAGLSVESVVDPERTFGGLFGSVAWVEYAMIASTHSLGATAPKNFRNAAAKAAVA
jgi:hypothetical protein